MKPSIMPDELIYRKIAAINKTKIGSCNILYIRPGGKCQKHFHKRAIEIEYVYKGSCQTHKKGQILIHKKNELHELINDSKDELVVICLKIPPYDEKDMNYIF